MTIERRGFFSKALVAGVGAAAFARTMVAYAKALPSTPGTKREAGAGADEILLPQFEKNGTYTLDQALMERKTSRKYDSKATMSMDQVSRIMWAANGVNRKDGHRTAPSAVASYPNDVYAVLAEGVYKYDLEEHKLIKVISEDIRKDVPIQPGIRKAAMKILYVTDLDRVPSGEGEGGWADLEIGCMVQNVYLEAAQLDLGCVVFAIVRYDKVSKAIGLKSNERLRIAQAVGPLR